MIGWPETLPQKVLRDGWSFVPQTPLRRTEMDDGAIAVARRHHRVRTLVNVSWQMTMAQFEVFKSFWYRDLDAGSAWFEAPVFVGMVTQARECRLSSDPPYSTSSFAPGVVVVSAQLELRDQPTITPAERLALDLELRDPNGPAAINPDMLRLLAAFDRRIA